MNIMLTLSNEEAEALMAWWADKIGRGNEAESDMASKRIAQLKRLSAPERRWDIEHEPECTAPVLLGVDFAKARDYRCEVATYRRAGKIECCELPTPSRFPEVRTR